LFCLIIWFNLLHILLLHYLLFIFITSSSSSKLINLKYHLLQYLLWTTIRTPTTIPNPKSQQTRLRETKICDFIQQEQQQHINIWNRRGWIEVVGRWWLLPLNRGERNRRNRRGCYCCRLRRRLEVVVCCCFGRCEVVVAWFEPGSDSEVITLKRWFELWNFEAWVYLKP
jgi:hypothetical protein